MRFIHPKLFFAVAAFSFLYGCGKNTDSFPITGEFTTDTVGKPGPVYMFTNKGRVTDAAVIRGFLSREGISRDYVFDAIRESVPKDFLKLSFAADRKVSYRPNDSRPIAANVVSESSSLMILTNADTVFSYVPLGTSENIMLRCSTIFDAFNMTGLGVDFTALSPATGYSGVFRSIQSYPLIVRKGELIMPVMSFSIKSTAEARACNSSIKDAWGMAKAGFEQALLVGDTVVYQIKEVRLVRQ